MKRNYPTSFSLNFLKEKAKPNLSFDLRNLLLWAAIAGSGIMANAQTVYEPTPLTGFTQDVVANGIGAAANSTTAKADSDPEGYVFIAPDYQADGSSPFPPASLPNGGNVVSGSKVYQLADYTTSNSLLLDLNSLTGTLTFVTPKQVSKVHVLGVSGSGESYVDAKVWFTDNTSETFTNLYYPDWFNQTSSGIVLSHVGRVNLQNNIVENGTGPQLSEVTINISFSNQAKLIDKIEFTHHVTAGNVMSILAISTSYTPPCSGTPNAGTISGNSSLCQNNPFTLTGSSFIVLGITYQWQNSVSGGNSWSDIVGANNDSVNISSGISSATDYRRIVTCTIGGASDTTPVFTVSLKPEAECFCTFEVTYGVEPITLVDFVEISHTSSDTIPGTPAFEDFTSITGNVTTEKTYPIKVKGNTDGDYTSYVTVFIDWNQNGSFSDAGETFNLPDLENTTGIDGQQSTGNIDVPWNAHAGATRMRVVKEYYYPPGGNPRTGPCGAIGFGQAEDYTLMVTTNPLAITLGNITAKNQGESNVVLWNTLREDEGDHFEVERSIDGRQFEIIGHQSGKGGPSTYTFVDHQPIPGINYYRLGLLNVDGSKEYSKIVQATMKSGNFAVEAYPNPTSNLLTIKTYGTIQANATITISDLTGRIVRTTKVTGPEIIISMSDLSSGSYIIKYNDNKQNAVLKITKK